MRKIHNVACSTRSPASHTSHFRGQGLSYFRRGHKEALINFHLTQAVNKCIIIYLRNEVLFVHNNLLKFLRNASQSGWPLYVFSNLSRSPGPQAIQLSSRDRTIRRPSSIPIVTWQSLDDRNISRDLITQNGENQKLM